MIWIARLTVDDISRANRAITSREDARAYLVKGGFLTADGKTPDKYGGQNEIIGRMKRELKIQGDVLNAKERRAARLATIELMKELTLDPALIAGLDRLAAVFQRKFAKPRTAPPPEAERLRWQEAQDKSMKTAANRGGDWTEAEEALVAQSPLTDLELAAQLGRTVAGVRKKRSKLRRASSLV